MTVGAAFWQTAGGTAADTTYDNTTSGLAATDLQAAIDELAASGAAGRWEVVVTGNPAEAVTTEDGTDWLYTFVSD